MVQEKNKDIRELKLDEFLRMVDVASAIRQKQEEVDQQLNIDEVEDELKKRLQDTAKIAGESLNDFQIELAIKSYLQGLYSFQEPERDFGTKLAEVYSDRVRLAKKFGIPPLVAVSAGVMLWLTIAGINSVHLRSHERGVEKAIESAYQEKQILSTETQELLSSPFVVKLPQIEKDKLNSEVSNSIERIKTMDPFFNKYCSDGTAKDDVTRENYQEAKNNLLPIQESLAVTEDGVQQGRVIIQTQEGLEISRNNLESLIGEIRNSNPLDIFSQRAETAYTAGLANIERRNLSEAGQNEQELVEIRTNISKFAFLNSQIETLYSNIRAVAKEDEAKIKADVLYKEAKQSFDVTRLSQTASQLQNLDNILNQEYTVKIINKTGVKSGIDRYFTDNNGRRVSGYYLIVEAINSGGNALALDITNEENGNVEKVTMWGERVPEVVYERVKEDKLDNGIINDNIVGKKQRGYLNEDMIMQGITKQGKITRW